MRRARISRKSKCASPRRSATCGARSNCAPDKLVSELQLDQAQSEVAALNARLEALRSEVQVAEGTVRVRAQDLDDLMVRAPFDGVVVSKDAQPGEMVSPISAGGGFTRTGIATIVDMDSREIEVDVNEAFINRVKANQKTEAVLDAYPDWIIPSHVINIVPTADRQKATVRVRIGFDALEPRILPDMGVKVSFLDDREVEAARRLRRRGRRCAFPSAAVIQRRRHELRLARAGRASSSASRCAPAASATDRSKCCRASMPGDVVVADAGRRPERRRDRSRAKTELDRGRGDSWRHLVRLRGVAKDYKRGAETVHVLHALDLDIPKGRFPRADGPVGLRQVDAAESDRRPRPADRRHDRDRRPAHRLA